MIGTDNLTLDECYELATANMGEELTALAAALGINVVTPEQKAVLLGCCHELYPDGTEDWNWAPGFATTVKECLGKVSKGKPAEGISSAVLDESVSANLDLF